MLRSPDTVGLSPRAIWKYCARKIVAPNIAPPTNSPAVVASVTVRFAEQADRDDRLGHPELDPIASASRQPPTDTDTAVVTDAQGNC